jgi:glutamine amidotransferase
MCRWFAYISSTEPCLLEDVLVAPKNSLTHQVHDHYLPQLIAHDPQDLHSADHLTTARNSLYNIDGLGVAWYTSSFSDFERGNSGESIDGKLQEGLRPAVYKTVQPPLNDMNFRSICANTETRVCMAHIRAASSTPIVAVNNHPFIFGRHTFMHNGVVSNFTSIKRDLCKLMSTAAYAGINGGTDSEHLAALYMSFLTDHSDDSDAFQLEYPVQKMDQAMNATVCAVMELQVSFTSLHFTSFQTSHHIH